MALLSRGTSLWNRATLKWMTSYRLNELRTATYGFFHRTRMPRVVYILGCQRSGTTMLATILGLSPQVKVYGEGAPEYFYWDGAPRLLPVAQVRTCLSQERSPIVLLKPLCESQRAQELLLCTPGSSAVWIFRNYRDCVTSHIKYYRQFHDGKQYVRHLLSTETPHWMNENLSAEIVDLLQRKRDQQLNVETCYGLYWLARNSLVFRCLDDRVKLVCYERLVTNPASQAAEVFRYLTVPYRKRYARIVEMRRNGQPFNVPIDDDVAEQCDAMYRNLLARLDEVV